MGNFWEDIVQDVDIKPAKSKVIIKWVVRIALLLITGAFIAGGFKVGYLNKMNNFENSLNENTKAVKELRQEMKNGFVNVNKRIDKVYDDGIKQFNDFQEYNNKQLYLIIDYGQQNKDLIKRMLDVNSLKKSETVETEVQKAKSTSPKNPSDTVSIIINKSNK